MIMEFADINKEKVKKKNTKDIESSSKKIHHAPQNYLQDFKYGLVKT